eukprot:8497689-Heterocapsa_arctica.AAC.1
MPPGMRGASPASPAGLVPVDARGREGGRSNGAPDAGGCAFTPSAANRYTRGRSPPQRRAWARPLPGVPGTGVPGRR